ncbi:WG repeat-containing protein [Ekhidna sp.]|uniref:WG repeat-containing protein n=1 Tax=Ekhidna sp. TaxID=2608089 RepID=UPI003296AB22
MRNFIFSFLFISSLATNAEEFTVFEKDGYFGIKDEIGNVTVPAVYEKLGWSNGSTKVHNGVIGFRRDDLWGLITVRNKALTGQKFYTIEPLSNSHFKASIKGRFSNHLFHGILDERGRSVISFNYFTIEPLGANWLVSLFNGKRQLFGVVSFENQLIIPTKYASINTQRELLIGRQISQKLDIYRTNGQEIQRDLDSLKYQNGWIAFRSGYAGLLTDEGQEVYPFEFKNFAIENEKILPVPFPEWTVYKLDSEFLKWQCDSLAVSNNGMLVAYLNGAHHLLLKNNTLLNNHALLLKEASNDHLIVQNSKTRKWSVVAEDGEKIVSGYDSITTAENHYVCLDTRGWHLIDSKGALKNRLPLQALKPGLSNQFVVKRNNHWGILNNNGESAVTFKYDSIVATDNEYLVSYLNRWGVLDKNEKWIIRSEFQEIISLGNVLIGRRGRGYTIFYEGKALYKTASKPLSNLGTYILIEGDSLKLGLMNQYGEVSVRPQYDVIRMWADHFELVSKERIALIHSSGRSILSFEDGYQRVGGFGDGYFVVKKEDRWGFVDDEGRLRISNRYDDARPFCEGLAPVMLRGRWGFINKDEEIKIQPYYQHVIPFYNGRTIVQQNGKFGLLNQNGEEVLELIWKSIRRLSTGNYIVQDINDRYGLVDENGSFIFRPGYDQLEDFGDRVLVSKNGAWGILNYDRHPVFKINHEDIKVIGDFTMVKD